MFVLHMPYYGSNNSTVVAHAGDGNFHTAILFDPKDEEQLQEAERLNHLMVHAALSMEGKYFISGQLKEYLSVFRKLMLR